MKLLGIDNLRGDLFIGIVAGISLIFANIVGIFSLGIPPTASVYATNLGKFAIVVLIAPILEEIFFRGFILSWLRISTGSQNLAIIIQAVIFGLFHMLAYSGVTLAQFEVAPVLAVGGAILSAIIFGIIFLSFIRKSIFRIFFTIPFIPMIIISFY